MSIWDSFTLIPVALAIVYLSRRWLRSKSQSCGSCQGCDQKTMRKGEDPAKGRACSSSSSQFGYQKHGK